MVTDQNQAALPVKSSWVYWMEEMTDKLLVGHHDVGISFQGLPADY